MTMEEKGKESLEVLDQKEKVIEAEIETHRVGLHDAKMRLRKIKSLRAQLNLVLAAAAK